MKEYPRWIYHPSEDPVLIEHGPIPAGWFDSPAKCEEPSNLDDMSKEEIEKHARTMGIELDRRKTKQNMIRDFYEAIK